MLNSAAIVWLGCVGGLIACEEVIPGEGAVQVCMCRQGGAGAPMEVLHSFLFFFFLHSCVTMTIYLSMYYQLHFNVNER